jgi:hypothetical protein
MSDQRRTFRTVVNEAVVDFMSDFLKKHYASQPKMQKMEL